MSGTTWFYKTSADSAKLGPIQLESLCDLFAKGQLPLSTLVYCDTIGDWVAAETISGFREVAASAPARPIATALRPCFSSPHDHMPDVAEDASDQMPPSVTASAVPWFAIAIAIFNETVFGSAKVLALPIGCIIALAFIAHRCMRPQDRPMVFPIAVQGGQILCMIFGLLAVIFAGVKIPLIDNAIGAAVIETSLVAAALLWLAARPGWGIVLLLCGYQAFSIWAIASLWSQSTGHNGLLLNVILRASALLFMLIGMSRIAAERAGKNRGQRSLVGPAAAGAQSRRLAA